jgi:hypothetical protein
LVIAGVGKFGGVAVPVASGLAYPADGGGGAQVDQLGEDGRGELGGEMDERGASAGLGGDA